MVSKMTWKLFMDGTQVQPDSYPLTFRSKKTLRTNTVNTGELDGQNDWQVDTTGVASVQTSDVYEGSQALSLSGDAS